MGMKQYYYFGPYLACGLKNSKKITRNVPVNAACFNPKCKSKHQNSSFKFCPECGGEIKAGYKEIIEDSIDMNIIESQIQEKLSNFLSVGNENECGYAMDNKLHIWIVNETVPSLKSDILEYGDEYQYMPIVNAGMIEKHKSDFLKQFEKEIAKIKEVYGEDQVNLEWGIFYYYM